MLERMRRKGNPSAPLVGMQTGAATVKIIVWNFLRKVKMELPFDSAIPLLGLYPKDLEINVCSISHTHLFCYIFQILYELIKLNIEIKKI